MKLFATNPIDALTFTNAPPRTMLYILAAFMMTINEWEKKDYTDGLLVLIRHLESEVQRLDAENNLLQREVIISGLPERGRSKGDSFGNWRDVWIEISGPGSAI